jgi:hypothetical protein
MPAVASLTPAGRRVLTLASQQGLRSASWLTELSHRQEDPQCGSALAAMTEAVAVALMAFSNILLDQTDAQREELLRLLDLHLSPDGSLVAKTTGPRIDAVDLLLVAALAGAVRTVVTLATMDWERDLPQVLELVDQINNAAQASLTSPPFAY